VTLHALQINLSTSWLRLASKEFYGIVGDSLNGLTDALRRQGKIEWIHFRHEEVAGFAAGAEAHLTSELAVCAGSCGPGNLHLINGLYEFPPSHRSGLRSPLHPQGRDRDSQGRTFFQSF
jgi:hypothetical protein